MQLEAKNIGFQYHNRPWLFRGLNFSLKQGEVLGLVGHSGQGKTTLCRILAGLEQPVEGKVTINDQAISKRGYHPIQLIVQHPEKAVNPRWKMRKVLSEGMPADRELMEMLGIKQEWLTRWPHELSGGELQRFCVLRALGKGTKFLIADEITTMLDAITQAQIWHAILKISKQRKMGILMVSHDAALVQRVCDHVIYLEDEEESLR